MPIVFSEHARSQIKRRNITRQIVILTVTSPEEVIASFRSRELRRKHVGDKLLEVVTRTEDSKITVITAYYLEE